MRSSASIVAGAAHARARRAGASPRLRPSRRRRRVIDVQQLLDQRAVGAGGERRVQRKLVVLLRRARGAHGPLGRDGTARACFVGEPKPSRRESRAFAPRANANRRTERRRGGRRGLGSRRVFFRRRHFRRSPRRRSASHRRRGCRRDREASPRASADERTATGSDVSLSARGRAAAS